MGFLYQERPPEEDGKENSSYFFEIENISSAPSHTTQFHTKKHTLVVESVNAINRGTLVVPAE